MLLALFFELISGLFIYLGSLLGLKFSKKERLIDFSISITLGAIMGVILFKIVPKTFNILNGEIGVIRCLLSIIVLILIGIFMLKILDLFIPHHLSKLKSKSIFEKNRNEYLFHVGVIFSIVVVVYNIINGMNIYTLSLNSVKLGILSTIGIGLCNIPVGLVIFSTLIKSKYLNKKVLSISLIISLTTLLGGFVMIILGGKNNLLEGVLIGIILGMLVYILYNEFLPQISYMKNKKIVKVGFIFGIIISIISLVLEKL